MLVVLYLGKTAVKPETPAPNCVSTFVSSKPQYILNKFLMVLENFKVKTSNDNMKIVSIKATTTLT